MKIFSWLKASKLSQKRTVGHLSLDEQKNILIDWASNSEMEFKWRKEIIKEISKMDKALNDTEFDSFIEELAKLKLGIGVTNEEARTIMDLSKKIEDAKVAMETGAGATAYKKALKELEDYKKKIIDEK